MSWDILLLSVHPRYLENCLCTSSGGALELAWGFFRHIRTLKGLYFEDLDWFSTAQGWQMRISGIVGRYGQGLVVQTSLGWRQVKQNLYFSDFAHLEAGCMVKNSLHWLISWLCVLIGQGNFKPGRYHGFGGGCCIGGGAFTLKELCWGVSTKWVDFDLEGCTRSL